MDVSIKQKADTKKQPEPTLNETIAKRRLRKFNGQLKVRPEMLAQFESIMAIAAQSDPDAPFRTADEVEALVLEAVRKLGHQTLWVFRTGRWASNFLRLLPSPRGTRAPRWKKSAIAHKLGVTSRICSARHR